MHAHIGDIDMAWFEVGRGSPLVLIHGLADDHRAWRRCLPELSLHHRVLLYDFRGHGQSSLGQAHGQLAQLAEDLRLLLDAVGLERASLAGFSLGGTIAMRFAIDNPHRVERLLPVATSSRVGRSAAEWYAERARLVEEASPQLRQTMERDTRSMFENAPELFEEHWQIRSQSTADPAGYASACRAMAAVGLAPLDPDLDRISAPTLVVAADRDPLCPPRAGQIICAGIPDSRLEIIAGCGHQIPVEKPAELSRLMLEFLADS